MAKKKTAELKAKEGLPPVSPSVFSAEDLSRDASVRNLERPGATVVAVIVFSREKKTADGTRGGWRLVALRRPPELIEEAARQKAQYHARYPNSHIVTWWWNHKDNQMKYKLDRQEVALPPALHPLAAAFAAGAMTPGIFSDALCEQNAVDPDVVEFLLLPYRISDRRE